MPRPSIAVLPFANVSPNPEDEYFSDGVTEEILTVLAGLGGLKVISRTSVMRYKGSDKPIPVIGRELGVATILEGSVRRSGGRVRITAQLIDARTDAHLWADRYDRELADIFAIQTDVAERIVEALRVRLTDLERNRIAGQPTENLAAWHTFLRGRHFLARRTERSIRRAIAEFERAVELDPAFARAWGSIATCWALLPSYSDVPLAEAAPRARAAAARALELDPGLGEAHAARGLVSMNSWELEDAEREYRMAIEKSPASAGAHHWYGNLLGYLDRHDEAIAELREALELDPLSVPIHMALGSAYYFARRYEESAEVHKATIALDPSFVHVHDNLAGTYMKMGRWEEALAELEQAARLDPTAVSPARIAELRAGFEAGGVRGFHEAALEGLRKRKEIWARGFDMAAEAAELGRVDEAIGFLEELVERRQPVALQIGVEPAFDPLRSDPRFQVLLERIGLGRALAR